MLLALSSVQADTSTPISPALDKPLSLGEVFQKAFEQNPQVLQALAGYRLAQLRIDEAYLALNPTLSMTADMLRESQDRFGINDAELELVFNFPLFSFGKVKWAARSAKLAAFESAEQLRTTIETLFQTVAVAFLQVKQAEQTLVVAQERAEGRQRYLQLSRNLLKAGEIAEYEVVQAESAVLSSQAEILDSQMQLQQARATLLTNLGVRPDSLLTLADLPEPSPPPDGVDEGLQRALERRPELSALRWGVASGLANVKARDLQNTPNLSILGQLDDSLQASTSNGIQMSQSWLVGLQLSWALYDGGAASNQAAQAKVMVEQVRQQLVQMERQVSLDVVTAYTQMTSLWQQIEVSRQALVKAQETATIAEARFRAGLSSGVELLSAQDSLNQARLTEVQAVNSYRLSQVNWNRAISTENPEPLPGGLPIEVDLGPKETTP